MYSVCIHDLWCSAFEVLASWLKNHTTLVKSPPVPLTLNYLSTFYTLYVGLQICLDTADKL